MNRGLGALALWALAASPAAAQAVSDAPSAASVTIYRDRNIATGDLGTLDPNQGLALITETRTVEVPAGATWVGTLFGIATAGDPCNLGEAHPTPKII